MSKYGTVLLGMILIIIVVAGCRTQPPEAVTKEFGPVGYSLIDKRGNVAIWEKDGIYVLTKSDTLLALVPTETDDDWLQIYEDGKLSLYLNRKHKIIRLTGPWKDRSIERK